MKTTTTLLLALLHAAVPALADTLYVNNDPAFPADYRNFDDAYAAASAGDTIMLAGSHLPYGNIAIVGKPIKLVGNGSTLTTEYPDLHPARADNLPTTVGGLFIGLGTSSASSGEDISGVADSNGTQISGINSISTYCWSSQCSIKSCKIGNLTLYGSSNVISRSQVSIVYSSTSTNASPQLYATGNLFRNCLTPRVNASSSTSVTFEHCVVNFTDEGAAGLLSLFDGTDGSGTLRHCIIGSRSGLNLVTARLYHCIVSGSGGGIPAHSADNGNLWADPSVLFVTGYKLKAGSPAIGAGENGEDLGMFGGPTPFEWGGVPAIPLIQRLNVLAADPTTGLSFRVEAEARD